MELKYFGYHANLEVYPNLFGYKQVVRNGNYNLWPAVAGLTKEEYVFPDRSNEIEFHKDNARKFYQQKNFDMARISFFKWVESVRQQNINTSGKLENELKSAQEEYSNFVKNDPLYINICERVLPKIKENPGILQTEIYKLFPDINKSDISYVLYFASDHGKISRTKEGRTYSISII